jgi:hypothetical protein
MIRITYLSVARSKNGNIDNSFGERTKKMVKSFQLANSLTDDGVVGRNTWSKLTDGGSVQAGTKNTLSCVKKHYEVYKEKNFPTQEIDNNNFRVHIVPFEMTERGDTVIVWNFKSENGVNTWNEMEDGQIIERGNFICLDDSNFRMIGKYRSKKQDGSIAKDGYRDSINNPSFKLFGPR